MGLEPAEASWEFGKRKGEEQENCEGSEWLMGEMREAVEHKTGCPVALRTS